MENSQASNDGVLTQDHNNDLPQMPATNGGAESEHELSAEEVKGALEIIASTGKFWHDWDELKSMLVFQLKQVLSEYPEATKGDDQQNSSLGESYLELAQRLDAALFSFIEGPPFTLQRLCEILLNARPIYPNLSKLALALEKNLLVTSTITKSTDPYPSSMMTVPNAPEEHVEDAQLQPDPQQQPKPEPEPQQPEPEPQQPEPEPQQPEPEPEPQQPEPQPQQPQPEPQPQQPEPEPEPQQPQPQPHSNSVENGGELATGDRDEVMSEVDTHVDDSMTIDMETFEEIISSSEGNPEPVIDS